MNTLMGVSEQARRTRDLARARDARALAVPRGRALAGPRAAILSSSLVRAWPGAR